MTLLTATWGEAHRHNAEYLWAAVRSLRLELEEDLAALRLIVNDPGVGSRLPVKAWRRTEQA